MRKVDLVFVVIAVLVVFVVVAVAADRVSVLDADEPQGAGPPVLPPSPIEPSDIESVRFPVVIRGYRIDHVDEVLARLRSELTERDERIAALEALASPAPPSQTPASE